MTLVIPAWAVVMSVMFAPFGIGWVASLIWRDGGFLDLTSPVLVFGAFVVSAGICWTGLIVWAVMR